MHVISGQENPKIRGGCRVGTACEPVGSWCFMKECRPQRGCCGGSPRSLPLSGVLGPCPMGTAAAQGCPEFPPQLWGAGQLVLAPGRKGCLHELMATLQRCFSPYSLFFFFVVLFAHFSTSEQRGAYGSVLSIWLPLTVKSLCRQIWPHLEFLR